MGKKNWVKVKRGILQPKHRMRLGVRIWLYLHILDRADWETGKVLEWRDVDEANELEMPIKTLRNQRAKLEEDGYISCIRGQHHQEIIIHRWLNPRKYDGKELNPKSPQNLPLCENPESPSESPPESPSESPPDYTANGHSSIESHVTDHISESSSTTTPVDKSSGAFKAAVSLGESLAKDNPIHWAYKGLQEGWIWEYEEMKPWKPRDYSEAI